MTYADFLELLLADVAKAPLLLADCLAVKTASEKLLTDAGLPVPWAGLAVAHSTETLALQGQVIDAFRNSRGVWECDPNLAPLFDPSHPHAIDPHKLGDGTLIKLFGGFLSSPLGQQLLGLLLGQLLPKPAA